MITDAKNKELSHAGFYPVNSRYEFEYRGVRLFVYLNGRVWRCSHMGISEYRWIDIPVELPALRMAAVLRQWILDTVPADRLREEGYRQLGWISSSVRASLAQERAEAASVPFMGELNPEDADDSIPGCYGL